MPTVALARRAGRAFSPLLALLMATSAFPQDNHSAVIRTTTRIVSVSLVVTDNQGHPIQDLTKDDVTLLDDGKPQPISFFSSVDNSHLLPSPPVPGPDIYTNVASGNPSPPSVTILLFDMLNSKPASQAYGLACVRKFLRQLQPQDHVGLYLLNDEMRVLHTFHADSSDLISAIRLYDQEHLHTAAKNAALETNPVEQNLDRFLSGKDSPSRYVIYGDCSPFGACADKGMIANEITTASLEEIARQLAPIPGRKTLIWVTDKVGYLDLFADNDLDPYLSAWRSGTDVNLPALRVIKNGQDFERMVRLMNGAGIAVYTVDARGLGTEDLDFRNTTPAASVNPVGELLSRTPTPNSGLLELASRTGGRAFFNRNDLQTGIRRALDDSRFTYNLAYYPDHDKWKGEWRNIQMKVNRPDVTVLARSGYFALPDATPLPPKNRFEFLSEIAASPVDSPQLPLAVRMAASSAAKGAQIEAHVHLNPQPLLTFQDDGRWKGSFEVVFLQMDAKNKVLDVTQKEIEANIGPDQYDALSRTGWTMPVSLKFMPGAAILCVILRDKLSDTVGSLHIPLAPYSAPLASH